jgi:hypothetical protein
VGILVPNKNFENVELFGHALAQWSSHPPLELKILLRIPSWYNVYLRRNVTMLAVVNNGLIWIVYVVYVHMYSKNVPHSLRKKLCGLSVVVCTQEYG